MTLSRCLKVKVTQQTVLKRHFHEKSLSINYTHTGGVLQASSKGRWRVLKSFLISL
jgi:hypothetical protein